MGWVGGGEVKETEFAQGAEFTPKSPASQSVFFFLCLQALNRLLQPLP